MNYVLLEADPERSSSSTGWGPQNRMRPAAGQWGPVGPPGASLGIKLEVEESPPIRAHNHFSVVHLHNVDIDMYNRNLLACVCVPGEGSIDIQ